MNKEFMEITMEQALTNPVKKLLAKMVGKICAAIMEYIEHEVMEETNA